jgi:hypothetical protein
MEFIEGEAFELSPEIIAKMTPEEREQANQIFGKGVVDLIAETPAPKNNGTFTVTKIGGT